MKGASTSTKSIRRSYRRENEDATTSLINSTESPRIIRALESNGAYVIDQMHVHPSADRRFHVNPEGFKEGKDKRDRYVRIPGNIEPPSSRRVRFYGHRAINNEREKDRDIHRASKVRSSRIAIRPRLFRNQSSRREAAEGKQNLKATA